MRPNILIISGEKMIIRNEIPILEYDDKSPEVIAPDHDWTGGRLPEKCLFAFLGVVVHKYAKEHVLSPLRHFYP